MSSSRTLSAQSRVRSPRKARPLRRSPRRPQEREIVDLLPVTLPITDAEIDILDKMLGSQIDVILNGSWQATDE